MVWLLFKKASGKPDQVDQSHRAKFCRIFDLRVVISMLYALKTSAKALQKLCSKSRKQVTFGSMITQGRAWFLCYKEGQIYLCKRAMAGMVIGNKDVIKVRPTHMLLRSVVLIWWWRLRRRHVFDIQLLLTPTLSPAPSTWPHEPSSAFIMCLLEQWHLLQFPRLCCEFKIGNSFNAAYQRQKR